VVLRNNRLGGEKVPELLARYLRALIRKEAALVKGTKKEE
jgi:type VI protein secretion system component VasF